MDIPLKKKKFTATRIAILVGVIGLIAFTSFVFASHGGSSKFKVKAERITIAVADTGIFQENIPVSGQVLPITTIYLDALEGGRVEEKFVEDGAV